MQIPCVSMLCRFSRSRIHSGTMQSLRFNSFLTEQELAVSVCGMISAVIPATRIATTLPQTDQQTPMGAQTSSHTDNRDMLEVPTIVSLSCIPHCNAGLSFCGRFATTDCWDLQFHGCALYQCMPRIAIL